MRKVTGGLVALLLLIPLPLQAQECAEGMIHVMPFCFSPDEYVAWLATQIQTVAPSAVSVAPTDPKGQARALVIEYFPAWAVESAMRVIGCETGYTYDPWSKNKYSGASGLFQHMPRYWSERSAKAGWGGWSIFNPEANVAVAAWLWGQTGTWQHWSCKPY